MNFTSERKSVVISPWAGVSWIRIILVFAFAVVVMLAFFGGADSISRKIVPLVHELIGGAASGVALVMFIIGIFSTLPVIAMRGKWLDALFMQAFIAPTLTGVGISLMLTATGGDGGVVGMASARYVWQEFGMPTKMPLGSIGFVMFAVGSIVAKNWVTRAVGWIVGAIPVMPGMADEKPMKHEEVTEVLNLPEVIEQPANIKRGTVSGKLDGFFSANGLSGLSIVSEQKGHVYRQYLISKPSNISVTKIEKTMGDVACTLGVSDKDVRFQSSVPGMPDTVSISIPVNKSEREYVDLWGILKSQDFASKSRSLPVVMGEDASRKPVIADLSKLPHLLVAGTTGSGKSVFINSLLLSLLFNKSKDDVRLVLIDPKMLELSGYSGIPHTVRMLEMLELLGACAEDRFNALGREKSRSKDKKHIEAINLRLEDVSAEIDAIESEVTAINLGEEQNNDVITNMGKASIALKWAVEEMERRYAIMSANRVRNIDAMNEKARTEGSKGLPKVVIIVDEFSDMMMVAGKEIETLITRLGQKARASGIHLVFATQRPSVDVISGLIKANMPSRLSFAVSSLVDSRTILDQSGAEGLCGYGDSLFLPGGASTPTRIQGAMADDKSIENYQQILMNGVRK